jgi:MFS family permease
MGAVFIGGLTRWLLTRNQAPELAERRRERGVLFGSGLVGGGGLTGVVLALWVAARGGRRIEGWPLPVPEPVALVLAALTIAAIVAILVVLTKRDEQAV